MSKKTYSIEVKSGKAKLSPLQEKYKEECEDSGKGFEVERIEEPIDW